MPQEKDQSGAMVWVFVAALIAILVLLWVFRAPLSIVAHHSALWMYELFRKIGFMTEEQRLLYAQLKVNLEYQHADHLSWSQIITLLDKAYRVPGILVGGLIALFGFGAMRMNHEKFYKRRMNMDDVLFQQALVFPEVRPVYGLGKKLLDRKSFYEGPWRLSESPIRFALRHGLLIDEQTKTTVVGNDPDKIDFRQARERFVLDDEKTREVLEAQLGPSLYLNGKPQFKSILNWGKAHKGLLLAFILFRYADKNDAVRLLNQFANSYWNPNPKTKKEIVLDDLNTQWVDPVLNAWLTGEPVPKGCPYPGPSDKHIVEEVKKELGKHAFCNCVLFHMLEKARERGIIVVSDFIWLRPVDRTLFYTLNNAGRNNPKNATGHIEGIGPLAHWQVEEAAQQPILVPDVREAIEGIELSLYNEGWVKASRVIDRLEEEKWQRKVREENARSKNTGRGR